MKVEIKHDVLEDYIVITPENVEDTKELAKMRPPYSDVVMGGFLNGAVGISCKK